MGYVSKYPKSTAIVKQLSRLNPPIAMAHLASEWMVIGGSIGASVFILPPNSGWGICFYVLVVLIVATRQQSLAVITHDAVHRLLARPFWFNDFLGRYFAAFPTFLSLSKWRFIHLWHHSATYRGEDPDVAIFGRYPVRRKKFYGILLRDLCGQNVLANSKYFLDLPGLTKSFNERFLGAERAARYARTSDMRQFWIFWAMALTLIGVFFGKSGFQVFALYWLVPYATFFQVLMRIRGAIEHGNVPDRENDFRQTRTYPMKAWTAYFLAPKNVNYHLEHHLYPSVPFYRLIKLHRHLQAHDFRGESAHIIGFAKSLRRLVK